MSASREYDQPDRSAPVETVLFDLDDTLCVYDVSYQSQLAEAFDRVNVEPYFDSGDIRQAAPEVAASDPLDFREKTYAVVARSYNRDPEIAKEVARAFQGAPPDSVQLRAGAASAVRSLEDRYQLGVVTNTTPEAMAVKLDTIGLRDAFDACIAPGTKHAPKPDTAMFNEMLNLVDASPTSTVHVGNSRVSDVAGAHAAGLRSIWVPTDRDEGTGPVPTWQIDSLDELVDPPWN